MANKITPLRIYQWGKETTKGTAVAATTPILATGIAFTPKDTLHRPNIARGYVMRGKGMEVPVERWTEWSLAATPLPFDQICNWLSMAVKGGVTPTGPTDSAYTWTFDRPQTSNVTADSWTLERRITDGSSAVDNEWAYALARTLTFRGAPNGEVTLEASGFARRVQSSTLTGSLTAEVGYYPVHGLSRLYIDSTVGGLGTTLVSSQLLDWSVTFHSGLEPYFTADNRSDLDYALHVVNGDATGFDFEATYLVDAQYALEKAAAEAIDGGATGGLRAMRLEVNHGVLIGVSSTRRLRLDMIARPEMGSVFEVGTRDGQDVVTVRYSETASTSAYWFAAEVRNDVSALG